MHELGLTQEIVDMISLKSQAIRAGSKVTKVVLEIGKLSAILPDAIRFCFDLCTEGTPIQGATLEIIESEGRARCQTCERESTFDRPYGPCECGGLQLEWLAGHEFKIKNMEIN